MHLNRENHMTSRLIKEIIGTDINKPTAIVLKDGSKISILKNQENRFWLKIRTPDPDPASDPFVDMYNDMPPPYNETLTPVETNNQYNSQQQTKPKKNFEKKYIKINAEKKRETLKAYLIIYQDREIWIPKSQSKTPVPTGENEYDIEITEWIAKQNNIAA
jgi:hypothetical protein